MYKNKLWSRMVKFTKKPANQSINRTVESGVQLRSTPLSTAGYFIVILPIWAEI